MGVEREPTEKNGMMGKIVELSPAGSIIKIMEGL